MKKEYLDPNFIGPILPPENLTEEQKAAVVKVILRYNGNSLVYATDRSQDASEAIAIQDPIVRLLLKYCLALRAHCGHICRNIFVPYEETIHGV